MSKRWVLKLVGLTSGLALAGVPGSWAQSTVSIVETVFAGAQGDGAGNFTTFIDISTSSEVSVETCGQFEEAAIIEFPLAGLTSPITAADLRWFTGVTNTGVFVSVYAYPGDGVAQLTDATRTDIFVGLITDESPPGQLGSVDVVIDVTSAVQQLIDANATHAGFAVRSTTDCNGRYAIESTIGGTTSYDPTLDVTLPAAVPALSWPGSTVLAVLLLAIAQWRLRLRTARRE